MPESTRGPVFRFLANSGIDEELLAIVRSWIGKPIEFYSVFLSHSSLDKIFARKLYADLRSVGVDCWFDEEQILPGDNILDLVDQGIRIWDKLILLCSEASLSVRSGWWIEQEIESALAKERQPGRTVRDSQSWSRLRWMTSSSINGRVDSKQAWLTNMSVIFGCGRSRASIPWRWSG